MSAKGFSDNTRDHGGQTPQNQHAPETQAYTHGQIGCSSISEVAQLFRPEFDPTKSANWAYTPSAPKGCSSISEIAQLMEGQAGLQKSPEEQAARYGLAPAPVPRENLYQVALYEAGFDPAGVKGFQEYKPGGFRYNPNMAYNHYINVAQSLRAQGANPTAKAITEAAHMGVHGQHYLDQDTSAGRAMAGQKAKHGEGYEPSKEALNRQYLELTPDPELKERLYKSMAMARLLANKTEEAGKWLYEGRLERLNHAYAGLAQALAEHTGNEAAKTQQAQGGTAIGLQAISQMLVAIFVMAGAAAIIASLKTHMDSLNGAIDDLAQDINIDELIDEIEGVEKPGKAPKPDKKPKDNPLPLPPMAEQNGCEVRAVGRYRGGHKLHNQLADSEPPNVKKGTEWDLYRDGKRIISYDALNTKNEIWEIKAVFLSQHRTDFYKRIILKEDIKQINRQYTFAKTCGFKYVLGYVDDDYLAEMKGKIPEDITKVKIP